MQQYKQINFEVTDPRVIKVLNNSKSYSTPNAQTITSQRHLFVSVINYMLDNGLLINKEKEQ